MKWYSRWLSLFFILLPLAVSAAIPLRPESNLYSASLLRAQASGKQQQFALQAADLNQALSISPWREDLWEELGHAEFQLKQYDKAIMAFEKAQQVSELSFQSLLELGQSFVDVGRVGDAQMLWRGMSERNASDLEMLFTIAHNQRLIGDTYGALATLLIAYRLAPADASLNYLLGIHLAVTQPASAVKFLRVSAASNLYQKGTSQALITVITGADQTPEQEYLAIGQILSTAGEWDLAARAFDNTIRSNDQNALAWALLGEALQHTGKSGLAELQKALDLDPNSDMANALMALYYRRQNKPDAALLYLNRAAEANPQAGVWQAEIGNTYAETGDLSSALSHYLLATQIAPDDPVTWQSLATFSFTHNYEVGTTGLNAARKALSLDQGNPVLLDLMGMGLLITGDLDSSERFLLQAEQADDSIALIHLHLGQLYIQKEDCSKAAPELQILFTLTTDERITSNASRLLSSFCPGF